MKKHWLTLSLVGLIMVVAVSIAFYLSRPQGNALYTSVKMSAQQTTELGIEPESGFKLTTGYRISADEVREMLEIVPPVEYEITGSGGKDWTLTPSEPLESNEIYVFRVKNPRGSVIQSFAFQTKSDLMVSSTYPTDEELYVSVDTGIELTFNTEPGDLSSFIEISPPLAGSFESSGFTVTFKPDQVLEPGKVYTVTLKAGAAAPNGMELMEDYTFRFQTAPTKEQDGRDYIRLRLASEEAETFLPGDLMVVSLQANREVTGSQFHTAIYQFPSITSYEQEVMASDQFYDQQLGSRQELYRSDPEALGLTLYDAFDGELFQKGEQVWEGMYAILPEGMPEGWYLVQITGTVDGREQFIQKFIQVRNMSVYTQSAGGSTLLWLNDPATGQPLDGRTVRLTDTQSGEQMEGTVQSDGTLTLKTGEMKSAYLTVLDGSNDGYFQKVPLSQEQESTLNERYYGGLYTDRVAYQPDDTVQFWGVLRPRKMTSSLPKEVWAELKCGWPEQTVYKVRVPVDENGVFSGSISFTGLRKNWYQLSITDEEGQSQYTGLSLNIGEYTKPAYLISVEPTKNYFYANEPITFQVNASYYDGTPVRGGRLRISGYTLGFDKEDQFIDLDENGNAVITGTYTNPYQTEDRQLSRLPSWQPDSVYINVYSADTQDVEISADATALVIPSNYGVKVEAEDPSNITIYAAAVDPSKLPADSSQVSYGDMYDQYTGQPADIPIIVHITRNQFVQTPVSTYYDYVNKRNVTKYKGEWQSMIVDNITTRTTNGQVTLSQLPYTLEEDTYYTYQVQFAGGIMGDVSEYAQSSMGLRPDIASERDYSFTKWSGYGTCSGEFALNEPITLGVYRNNMKQENQGKVLFTVVQQQSLSKEIFTEDEITLPMSQDFIPNVVIAGAYFDGRHVYNMEPYQIVYKYDEQELKLAISTQQEQYKPGDTVQVEIQATLPDGQPAANAQLCVGVVDEAIFDVTPQNVDLVGQIYATVFRPDIQEMVSYTEYDLKADAMSGGMGGGGGEGGGPPRDKFLDTALFQRALTDENGKVSLEVTLPDNVTKWRITAVGITADLKAGDNLNHTIATLPFYLQPLMTDSYLEGDDLAVSVDCNGTDPSAFGETVEYTITLEDVEGQQVAQQNVSGKPGERVTVNFGKQPAGQYSLLFSGKTGEYSDSMRLPVSVIQQGIELPILKNMSLEELSSLESLRYPVDVVIYDQRTKPYMDALAWLMGEYGDRTEIIAANYKAQLAYNDLLEPENRNTVVRDTRLDRVQDDNGLGVRMLPNAAPDAVTTTKMLVACPDLVYHQMARQFLEQTLRDPAANQDERVMAYVGLAALGEPILRDVNNYLETNWDTLTDTQKLWMGVGLAELGDFTGAQKAYESLASKFVTEGDLRYYKEGSVEDQITATGAALALTSITYNEDADSLLRFFLERDNDRAKVDRVIPHLEILTYIRHFGGLSDPSAVSYQEPREGETQTQVVSDGEVQAKFRYWNEGKEQQVELGSFGRKPMSLSYEALRDANFKVVSGEAYASVWYTTNALPVELNQNQKVTIQKTYTPITGDSPTVGGQVRVDLTVTFAKDAPEGCYQISDYIPSGLRFMSYRQSYSDENRFYMDQEGQKLTGNLYWSLPEDEASAEEAGKMNPGTEEVPVEPEESAGSWQGNVYKASYYLMGVLPGEFVTESAYITPYTQGIAAQTERGTITVSSAG